MNENLNILLGDITSLEVDIIVNADNKTLLGIQTIRQQSQTIRNSLTNIQFITSTKTI